MKKLFLALLLAGIATSSQAGLNQVPGPVYGDQTGTAAVTGFLGEHGTLTGSSTGLTSATYADLITQSLNPGVWNVQCSIFFAPAGTTTVSALIAGVNSVANTDPNTPQTTTQLQATFTVGGGQYISSPPVLVNVTTATVYRCGGQANFGVSTLNAIGTITWTRVK